MITIDYTKLLEHGWEANPIPLVAGVVYPEALIKKSLDYVYTFRFFQVGSRLSISIHSKYGDKPCFLTSPIGYNTQIKGLNYTDIFIDMCIRLVHALDDKLLEGMEVEIDWVHHLEKISISVREDLRGIASSCCIRCNNFGLVRNTVWKTFDKYIQPFAGEELIPCPACGGVDNEEHSSILQTNAVIQELIDEGVSPDPEFTDFITNNLDGLFKPYYTTNTGEEFWELIKRH